MKLSLVICTRNRPDVLINNLSINVQELNQQDEVIIVDSSDEQIFNKIRSSAFFQNTYFYNVSPGLPKQRNFGISRATGDIIIFLDDDIRLYRQSLENLRRFFTENQNIDALTGALDEKNSPSFFKICFESFFSRIFSISAFGKSRLTRSGLPIIPLAQEKMHKATFLRGGFSAYRIKIFETLKYDEFFENYAYLEDTDFSHCFKNKYSAVFFPGFSGYHDHLSSTQIDHTINRKQYILNFDYIFKKHKIGSRLLFYWSLIGLLLINLVKSVACYNRSYVIGTWEGIISVIENNR